MADQVPIRADLDGSSLTGLAIFSSGETVGVAHGGTGLATVGANQLLTGNGTSALSAESNLTFDGTRLGVNNTSPSTVDGNTDVVVVGDGSSNADVIMYGPTDGNGVLGWTDTANTTNQGSIQYLHSSDAMTFQTGAAERMRILSGGGITFNGDTAAANALDDYEEGTFTPVLKYSTTAYSLGGVTRGIYTKIGKLVWFNASINCLNPSASNDASPVTMEGLPYAVGSAADYTTHSGRMTYFIESNAWFTPYTIPSSSKIQFFYSSNSAAWGVVNSRDIYNASYANDMVITGAYMIA